MFQIKRFVAAKKTELKLNNGWLMTCGETWRRKKKNFCQYYKIDDDFELLSNVMYNLPIFCSFCFCVCWEINLAQHINFVLVEKNFFFIHQHSEISRQRHQCFLWMPFPEAIEGEKTPYRYPTKQSYQWKSFPQPPSWQKFLCSVDISFNLVWNRFTWSSEV